MAQNATGHETFLHAGLDYIKFLRRNLNDDLHHSRVQVNLLNSLVWFETSSVFVNLTRHTTQKINITGRMQSC